MRAHNFVYFLPFWYDILLTNEVFSAWHRLIGECMHDKLLQSCLTLCDPMVCSLTGSSVHGDSPGKNSGVGCHALLQGIFSTQG